MSALSKKVKVTLLLPKYMVESLDTRTISAINQGDREATRTKIITQHLTYALNDSYANILLYGEVKQ